VVDCTLNPRNPCGVSTYVPTSAWALEESTATYQRERRNYTLTVYQPGSGGVCGPYQGPSISEPYIERFRYKECPPDSPWHAGPVNGFAVCTNSLTADINQQLMLGGCYAEEDGRSSVVGNPCDAATGNKLEAEPDYIGRGIEFTRYYNSNSELRPESFGIHWTHNYAQRIIFRTASGGSVPIAHVRADGQGEKLVLDCTNRAARRGQNFAMRSINSEVCPK
jgi:hypothetical protein